MLMLANQLVAKFTAYSQHQSEINARRKSMLDNFFEVNIIDRDIWLSQSAQKKTLHAKAHVIVLPPSIEGEYFVNPR